MTLRLSRTLPDRAIPPEPAQMWHALNFQIVPVLRELIRALTAEAASFTWTENEATIDLGTGSDFASDALTGDSLVTLANGVDGMLGTIVVAQDGLGGHGLTFEAEGRTVILEDPFVDTDPNPDFNSLTSYRYHFISVSGTPYLIIERTYLL